MIIEVVDRLQTWVGGGGRMDSTTLVALTSALSSMQASLQTLVAQGAARDLRETARDLRETARDLRETARDLCETARHDALIAQGGTHMAALDRVLRGVSALQLRGEDCSSSPQRSPFARVSRAAVGDRALAALAAGDADQSFAPTAGPAALTPALLASLHAASSEEALVGLVLPQLRELMGCGAAGGAAATAHDACARVLIDGQGHSWLDSLAERLPSSRREKPDMFLVPAPCWSGEPAAAPPQAKLPRARCS